MLRVFAFLFSLSLLFPARAAEPPTASELLRAMDAQLQYESRTAAMTMEVTEPRSTRTYEMMTFGRGKDEAAIEYLSPEREKGTRMLKKGGELWIYMPRAERTQKISGHMLRQGMMGSDVSYEDLMDSADFEAQYDATVVGEEIVDGRPCWRLEATARDASVSYARRILWVDEEFLLPLKQELYALSGMLLKTWIMSDVQAFPGDRHVPMRMEISDALRAGSRTTVVLRSLEFGVALEEEIFTTRWLERK